MTATTGANCDFDPQSKSLETAQQDILAAVKPVSDSQTICLDDALGWVLAKPVISASNVPPHANSAMDGYALRIADLPSNRSLPVAGTNLAGVPSCVKLPAGQCLRIMTGAVLPAGADAVVMQEQVSEDGINVVFPEAIKPQQNIRPIGDDIQAGTEVLAAGRLLGPAELGVLASLGFGEVAVNRRIKVGVFVTGNELQSPGNELAAGQIYDSNRITLLALLENSGCEAVDLGRVPDSLNALVELLKRLAGETELDAVVTTGGVSVGEADFVRDAVAAVGQLQLWRVAVKPGRPFAYGVLPNQLQFFGLPGNPVSAVVTFLLLVRPALQKMSGTGFALPQPLPAVAQTDLRKRPGRADYQRGYYQQRVTGTGISLQVSALADQGSGRLSSLTEANCLIALAADEGDVAAGSTVGILPFSLLF